VRCSCQHLEVWGKGVYLNTALFAPGNVQVAIVNLDALHGCSFVTVAVGGYVLCHTVGLRN